MSRFTKALVVSPLADGKTWVVLGSFGYEVGRKGSGDVIDVSEGFMTDFASIPKLFRVVVPRWGKYGNATVIHDWLYWSHERERREADDILFEAMGELSVAPWRRNLIYWAVKIFGGIAWTRNRWDREEGFDRVVEIEGMKASQVSGRPCFLRRLWQRSTGSADHG